MLIFIFINKFLIVLDMGSVLHVHYQRYDIRFENDWLSNCIFLTGFRGLKSLAFTYLSFISDLSSNDGPKYYYHFHLRLINFVEEFAFRSAKFLVSADFTANWSPPFRSFISYHLPVEKQRIKIFLN